MSCVDEGDEYPEGGMKAWLTVLGAWCAMIPSMGLLNTHAIIQAWVLEHELKGLPESQVGWIFSCYAFFLYFCGAQVGEFCGQVSFTLVLTLKPDHRTHFRCPRGTVPHNTWVHWDCTLFDLHELFDRLVASLRSRYSWLMI